MVTMRNPFRRQDSVDATSTTAPELAHRVSAEDVKSPLDEKKDAFDADATTTALAEPHEVHAHNPWAEAGEENMLANGKERPIEVSQRIRRGRLTVLGRLYLRSTVCPLDRRGHCDPLHLPRRRSANAGPHFPDVLPR